MPVTININNLTLCHKGSNGISSADVPDMCLAPGPSLVPYPNIAKSSDLAKGTTTVAADGGNMCANYGSEFSKSTGDEGGSLGGMCSGTCMEEATWLTFSFDTKLEGAPACRLTDKMLHNHGNTVNSGGEVQKDLPPSEHKCAVRKGNWTDGPRFEYEGFWITGVDKREIDGTWYNIVTFKFKGKFLGAVECVCIECGTKTSHKWESKSLEKEYFVGKEINWIMEVMPWGRVKTAITAFSVVKGMIKLDQGIQEYGPHLRPTLEKIEKVLQGAADLICAGELKMEQVQAWFDAAFAPPIPPGYT